MQDAWAHKHWHPDFGRWTTWRKRSKKQCAKKYCCVIKHVKHVGKTDIWQLIHQQTSSTYNSSNNACLKNNVLQWKNYEMSNV